MTRAGFFQRVFMRSFKRICILGFLSLSFCLPEPSPAQSLEAGDRQLLHQQERDRALRQQQREPDVRLQSVPPPLPAQLMTDESPCFTIREIQITGDLSERFAWLARAADEGSLGEPDPVAGRCLGGVGIQQVIQRMQAALIRKGLVTTRVFAEPQDISSGALRISVIPGRMRSVRFAEGTSSRATLWNAMPLQPGDLLDLRALEQAIENFKRVPSADADIQLLPAEGKDALPGDTDVVIRWSQSLPLRLNLSVDDAGLRSTGRYQGTATLSYDHWWTLNDLFYISFGNALGGGLHGPRDSRSRTVHYSVPFREWILSLTNSDWDYSHSTMGHTGLIRYHGSSSNSDVSLGRVLYRDATRKTSGSVRLWLRDSRNYVDDGELPQQRRRTAGWEFSLNHRELLGSAAIDGSLSWRRGTGAAGALRAAEEPYGEGSSRAGIVRSDITLSLPFRLNTQSLRYSAGWRAQWNATPLTPQDRFAMGNRYTVRGFDGESLLIGDRGWLLRQDIGLSVTALGSELYAGVDTGRVDGQSATQLAWRQLTGAVIGLRGGSGSFAWDVFMGQPVSMPAGFRTADTTGGFYVSASF